MICKPFNSIFVHIPKAAGRSIEQFFMDKLSLSRDNANDRKELLLTDNDDPAKGTEKLSHLSAQEYVECGYVSKQDIHSSVIVCSVVVYISLLVYIDK